MLHQQYKVITGNSPKRPILQLAQLMSFGIEQNSGPGRCIL